MNWKGPGLELALVEIASLKRDPKNARKHSRRSLDAIKTSLSEFGQRKPIVVRDGLVVAGNGLHQAAEELGWTHVRVVYASDLTSDQAREYAIADNQTGLLSEWDYDALGEHFREIQEDRRLLLGFDPEEVKALLDGKSPEEWRASHEWGGGDRPEMVSFRATEDQAQTIREALKSLREREGEDSIPDGRALELICADYLSGA